MDDFKKSVKTIDEAIDIRKDNTEVLERGGFELKKRITNYNNVNQSILSTHRSNCEIKTIELEPQTSSILGLQWNVIGESLEVCR